MKTKVITISTLEITNFCDKSMEDENLKEKEVSSTGLRSILFVHSFMGISYFGASPSKPLPFLIKIFFILLNLGVFVFSYYAFHTSVVKNESEPVMGGSHEPVEKFLENQKSQPPLITYLRYSSIAIYNLFSYILNLYLAVIGRSMFRKMGEDLLPLMEPKNERRIGYIITLVQAFFVGSLTAIFQLLVYLKFKHFLYIRMVECLLNLYSLSAPIAIVAYINLSLACIIKKAAEQDSMSVYIQRLLLVGSLMTRATSILGPALIVIIINSMVVSISSACLMITDYDNTFFISITGFLVYGAVLITLVLVASYAYETSKSTSSRFKLKMSLAVCGHDSKVPDSLIRELGILPKAEVNCQLIASQMMILASLEENIRMSPLGLFYLIRSYILTFFAIMLSYSVILVQTSSIPIVLQDASEVVIKNVTQT